MWQPFDSRLISQPVGFEPLPAGWILETQLIPSSDPKIGLFCYRMRKENPSPASRALFLLHGMGEHSGRYLHLAAGLASSIDEIVLYDQRGHGRSQGAKGHVPHFDVLVQDAQVILAATQIRELSHQVYLLGHSMGGHVALRLWLNYPEHGLSGGIYSSPFLAVKQKVPEFKKIGAQLLKRIWGNLQLRTGIMLDGLSTLHEVREHDFALAAQIGLGEVKSAVQIAEFPAARHESMNDADRFNVFETIKKWMESRTP